MKRFLAIPFLVFIAIVTGLTVSDSQKNQPAPLEVANFKASDGVLLVADYYPGVSRNGVILLHMMPETRASWENFAKALQTRGFSVLAIDLRGHGDSAGGPLGYRSFSDLEHQKGVLDVRAGVEFLGEKGIVSGNMTLIGASIGANLALQYVAEHPEIPSVGLLSPGIDYHGIKSLPMAAKLISGQRIFIAASEDDDLGGVGAATVLRALVGQLGQKVERELVIYKEAGHGTRMFGAEEPDLVVSLLGWAR